MINMKKEQFSHKDFTLGQLKVSAKDRIILFEQYIDQLKNNNHEIYWIEATTPLKPSMKIYDKRTDTINDVLSFVSNDYLGMSQNPEVIQAGIDGLKKYGTGVCAAPCIGGYLDIHKALEKDIAEFTGQDDAMLFSSGFGANFGILNALLGKEDLAICDTGVHTSILDGLRSTNVKLIPHNNLEFLEMVLERQKENYKTRMVIVDGVYSQDGDLCPLPEIIALCKKYDALLVLDDAHGIGVFGKNGRGTAEHFNVLGEVDIITGTFSKSFGAVGGFVAASEKMIQYLKYYTNTSIFSASIIPQVTCSVHKALDILKNQPEIRGKLWENTKYLKEKLLNSGFEIGNSDSPIIPFMVRDDFRVKEITMRLRDYGIYAIGIVYPAVRSKDARIRITVTASHEKYQIDKLSYALCDICQTIPNKTVL